MECKPEPKLNKKMKKNRMEDKDTMLKSTISSEEKFSFSVFFLVKIIEALIWMAKFLSRKDFISSVPKGTFKRCSKDIGMLLKVCTL